jgi:hypothetical protein
MMRARPGDGAILVPAGQVRGRRQPLQVLRLKRGLPVGGRQQSEGIPPSLPPEGLPASIEGLGHRASLGSHRAPAPGGGAFKRRPDCSAIPLPCLNPGPASSRHQMLESASATQPRLVTEEANARVRRRGVNAMQMVWRNGPSTCLGQHSARRPIAPLEDLLSSASPKALSPARLGPASVAGHRTGQRLPALARVTADVHADTDCCEVLQGPRRAITRGDASRIGQSARDYLCGRSQNSPLAIGRETACALKQFR